MGIWKTSIFSDGEISQKLIKVGNICIDEQENIKFFFSQGNLF